MMLHYHQNQTLAVDERFGDYLDDFERKMLKFRTTGSSGTSSYPPTPTVAKRKSCWRSCWSLNRLLWLLFITAALIVTGAILYQTVKEYKSEETYSKISLVQSRFLRIPNPTVCVELDDITLLDTGDVDVFDAVQVGLLLNTRADEILYLFRNLTDEMKVEKLNPRGQFEKFLSPSKQPLLRPFVYLTTQLVTAVVGIESGRFSTNTQLTWAYLYDQNKQKPDESLQLLYNFFVKHQLNFGELLRISGTFLCTFMQLEVVALPKYNLTRHEQLATMDLCLKSHISWLGASITINRAYYIQELCIRPAEDLDLLSFTNPDDQISILLQPQKLFKRDSSLTSIRRISLDFKRDPLLISLDSAVDAKLFGRTEVLVEITGENKQLSTSMEPCSSQLSPIICRLKCRADDVQENCNCSPVSLQFFNCRNGRGQNCNFCPGMTVNSNASDYLIPTLTQPQCYNSIVEDKRSNKDCPNHCYKMCQSQTLKLTSKLTAARIANYTEVSFQLPQFNYPRIEQRLLISRQSFIAQIGGILGLFFGGTFFLTAYLLVKLIRFGLFNCTQLRRNSKIAAKSTVSGNGTLKRPGSPICNYTDQDLLGYIRVLEQKVCEHSATLKEVSRLRNEVAVMQDSLVYWSSKQKGKSPVSRESTVSRLEKGGDAKF